MAEIIVDQTDLNITITPNTTQLNVFTGGYACAQGNTTEFQYNNGGVLAGANGLTYNSGSQTTTAANLIVTNDTNLGAVGNVTITGGNVGDVLQTDGAGGLSFGNVANANYATYAGTVLTNAQPNITSVGNLSNLTVTGNATANFFIGNGSQLTGIGDGTQISNGTSNVRVLSANGAVSIGVNGNANILVANATGITVTRANLGNASNLTITGGINGYFLQTDGTGNLTWAAGGNVSGNGVPGGANTQIQFNDGGSFGGKAGFTFNRNTDLLNAPGAITAVGNVQGAWIKGDGGLLSNVAGGAFIANGNSNIQIATLDGNATITVNNTTTTTFANNVINVAVAINTNSQINSAVANGTAPFTVVSQTKVANLNVDLLDGYSTATAATANTVAVRDSSGNLYANYLLGNGAFITGLDPASISNGNANVRAFANANVTVSAAGNANVLVITGTGINIAGTLNATGVITGNGSGLTNVAAATAGTVTNPAQPNITSVGALTSLTVSGNANIGNLSVTGTISNVGNLSVNTLSVSDTITSQGNIYANLSWVYANILVGTLNSPAQPNITSVGNLTGLNLASNSNLNLFGTTSAITGANLISANNANISNVLTVNTLNVTTFNASSLVNGNSNVRIATDSNVSISVRGVSNIFVVSNTGANISGTINATGNANTGNLGTTTLIATTGNITTVNSTTINSGLLQNGNSNITITSNGNIAMTAAGGTTELIITSTGVNISGTLNATGNANVGNISAAQGIFTNVSGNGSALTSLTGSNVTGQVGNALISGTVYTAAQPNITSVGTLTGLNVNGNITAANITANTGVFTGNGSGLSAIAGANVTGTVANATHASTANTVTTAAQPNITSVGTLTSLTVSGNMTLSNVSLGGNLIPNVGNTYNLGNATNDFRDLRLSNTIFWSNTAYLESVGTFRFSAGGQANALVITAFTTTMNTGSLSINGVYVKTQSNTIASLGSAIEGARAFANDANLVAAGNFGAIVSGGGANKVPVYGDGINWRIG